MEKSPGISIITVVYNDRDHLELTIQSVLNQTYENVEYIIIDGGSNDGTLEIIKKYEDRISYWISEPDNGLYDAMNKGLNKAKQDYLLFLNSGDELNDTNTLSAIFLNEESDIYYGESAFYQEDGKYLGLRSEVTTRKMPENLSYRNFIYGMSVSHQSFIVKRSIAPLYNLKYSCSADIDWCIRCLKNSVKTLNTKIVISRYRVGGFSNRNRAKCLIERLSIHLYYFSFLNVIRAHLLIFVRYIVYNLIVGKRY